MLRRLFSWLFNVPIPRDDVGRWISRRGRAYQFNLEPIVGSQKYVSVELIGGPIPNTFIPSLVLHCRCSHRSILASVRRLLDMADSAEARFGKATEIIKLADVDEAKSLQRVENLIPDHTMPEDAGGSAEVVMPEGIEDLPEFAEA